MSDIVGQRTDLPQSDPRPGEVLPPEPGHSRRRSRRRVINLIAFFTILFAGIAVAVLLVLTKPELAPVARQETVFTVETRPVEVTDNRPQLTVFGEIAAGQEAELRALVAGDVVETSPQFRNGGAVRKGDMLLKIDPFDYRSSIAEARAQIAETRARISSETRSLEQDREMLRLREADTERVMRLHKRGNISDKTRDDAMLQLSQQRQTVARREAAIQTERARLDQQQVGLERAERDLVRTELRAPFDGFLSDVAAQEGSVVNSNDRVARLVGAGSMEARGHLSDAQYGRLLQDGGVDGRPATVVWKVGDQDIRYDAVIARLTASIDADTGGVTFYALLDAEGLDLPIRPGAFVEISLPDRHFPDSVRLPSVAVHDDSRVFVIEDGRLIERKIRILGREGDDVIVRGDLETGERVVLTRFSEMAQGIRAEDPTLPPAAPDTEKPATGE
ncbi:efflux RND transporter periplasmic adaptor subunit [Minwuia sp.]|uniref:efflux RND transporter periplasmic adaptor subunit n=1 Tax=Minwuia sp. TaxID=2493630 RepID=UPI003A942F53